MWREGYYVEMNSSPRKITNDFSKGTNIKTSGRFLAGEYYMVLKFIKIIATVFKKFMHNDPKFAC